MSPLTKAQSDVVAGLDTNYCVTSGAGCGKTRVLVERYIRFLEQDLKLPLERLAAITFTENASAEMRDRIRRACREKVDAARQAADAVLIRVWLQRYWDVDVAPITTIHGFASALLRRYPIEAGVDPGFSLLDEAQAALLQMDVVSAAIEGLLEQNDADLVAVIEHLGLTGAREALAEVVSEKREVLQRVAAPVMAGTDESILAALRKAVSDATARLLREAARDDAVAEAARMLGQVSGDPADRREQVRADAVARLAQLEKARTADTARAAAQWLADHIDLRGGSAKKWPSKETFKAVADALRTVRDTLTTALEAMPPFDEATEREHLALARAFYRTAGRLVEAYEAAKRDRSALDFEDLQIRARNLLRDTPRVRDECRRRFRAILVDELQDTNLLQFDIVELLVSGAPTRTDPAPLRRGAFFGVGDPKQSIYRFRGAEVEVFRRALDKVSLGGRKGLSESFRLHPGTAALVNHVFAGLMGDGYEPIEGKRTQHNEAVGEFHIVLEPEGGPFDAETACAAEAERLAARLREIVEGRAVTVGDEAAPGGRPACYGDVAVLLRRTTHLHLYEESLERQGVPYYVVSGGGFYTQQEVLDVIHLLRVLDDPHDELHLTGVLRSPFFAVSDEGLYRLRRAGKPLDKSLAAAAAGATIDAEDRRGLARAAALLPRWTADKDRLGLAALVDRVVFESGYAAASVGRFGGARAYANLRQMVEMARRFERAGLAALGDYVDYVTDFMRSEMREEQAPVDAPGGDTVRLMTIHKAKGLEFPVVVVPDLAYAPRGWPPAFHVHPACGLAVRMRDDDGESRTTCATALARYGDRMAARAEEHRLLYVAITRAKDYLILLGQGRYNARRKSWFDALSQGLGANGKPGNQTLRLPTGDTMLATALPPQTAGARRGARRGGPRDVFAAGRVGWDRLHERAGAASASAVRRAAARATPPAAEPHTPARISATALATCQRCPQRYGWSVVLGVDEPGPISAETGLSPRAWGTMAHRALELARSPDPAAVSAAVEAALGEAPAVAQASLEEIRRRLADMVASFWKSPIGRRLRTAKHVYREMPFLLKVDQTEISGTMDLVFEGADGEWEVVDYKSSSPPAGPHDDLRPDYRLQLGLYALAARQWLGRPLTRWSVFFLGRGVAFERVVTPACIESASREIREALEKVRGQPYNNYSEQSACPTCRYAALCGTGSA